MPHPDPAWLFEALADPSNGWSVGTFGAIAEFTRDPGEPARVDRDEVSTSRGAMRLAPDPAMVPVAYETPNRDGETWSHAVALCLPDHDAAMNGRTVLTELGPDGDAIRPEDRAAILFDMGLGTRQVDVCIRTADPHLIATLRGAAGRSLFEAGNPAMGAIVAAGPHRVFVSRVGRAEVYQPIPPPDGQSPDGPHTHVLPKLLRTGRTHAATTPIPAGLVPCAHLFPPNPAKDAIGRRKPFDPGEHARFQALFAGYGGPDAVRIKRDASSALERGLDPGAITPPDDKHGRAALKVAIRQARLTGLAGAAALDDWGGRYDRVRDADPEEADDVDEQPSH